MIEFLQNRASAQKLGEPGPGPEQVAQMLRAAVAAPDHGRLRPWRFVVMRGEGRKRLADLMVAALRASNPAASAMELEREAAKPMRAPVVIAVVAKTVAGGKIPVVEQVLAAGAAGAQLMLAANALGFGVAWKTGSAAHDASVRRGLGFDESDEVVGFFYIGTDVSGAAPLPRASVEGVVEYWG